MGQNVIRKYKYIVIMPKEKEEGVTHVRKYNKNKFQIRLLDKELTSINGVDFLNFLS